MSYGNEPMAPRRRNNCVRLKSVDEHEWFNSIQLLETHSPLPEGTILLR
jgi:hypothetical protein